MPSSPDIHVSYEEAETFKKWAICLVSDIILCVVVLSQPTHKDSLKHKVRIQKKNGRYYFQHPYARLFVAYFVIFCNFLIYAEDPVSHSRANCTIPLIGNDYAFVTYRYCTESKLNGEMLLVFIFTPLQVKNQLPRCHCKTWETDQTTHLPLVSWVICYKYMYCSKQAWILLSVGCCV